MLHLPRERSQEFISCAIWEMVKKLLLIYHYIHICGKSGAVVTTVASHEEDSHDLPVSVWVFSPGALGSSHSPDMLVR